MAPGPLRTAGAFFWGEVVHGLRGNGRIGRSCAVGGGRDCASQLAANSKIDDYPSTRCFSLEVGLNRLPTEKALCRSPALSK